MYFSIARDLGASQNIGHSPGLSHVMETHEGRIYKLMQSKKVAADTSSLSLWPSLALHCLLHIPQLEQTHLWNPLHEEQKVVKKKHSPAGL